MVGGGPAGCASALALSQAGHSVGLVERSQYQRVRIGETLPPAAKPVLADLGLWERFLSQKHARSNIIRSAWGRDALYENDFSLHPYGSWWHLDRRSFDEMLVTAAEETGVRLYRGSKLRSLTKERVDRWLVGIADGTELRRLRASFIVDATGRAASVTRRQGATREPRDSLIGLVGFLSSDLRPEPSEFYTLLEATDIGWWYSARLRDRRLVAAFMTDSDLIPRNRGLLPELWHRLLRKTVHTGRRLEGLTLEVGLHLVAANTAKLDHVFGDGWMAAGDAALSFDPLSSQGICHALESGILGGQAIARHLAGDETALPQYADSLEETYREYLRSRARYYSREQRWPESLFWQRRHVSERAWAGGPG